MSTLSDFYKTLWRSGAHEIELYTYIHKPDHVFRARVNMSSYPQTITSVTFDGVTLGAYTDIQDGMTVMIGTDYGLSDYGMTRVRSNVSGIIATSTSFNIQRSSVGDRIGTVKPIDDAYITILDHRRIWSTPPYLSAAGTIYKDADIPFDGDIYLKPIVNIGTDVLFIVDDPSDTVTLNLLLGPTTPGVITNPNASSITNYLWDVDDGTIAPGDEDEVSPEVTFGVGKRYVSLIVQDDLGGQDIAYSLIVVLDKNHADLIKGGISRHVHGRDGQEVQIETVSEQLDGAFYGSEVLVRAVERYNDADGSLGYTGSSWLRGMVFAGWMTAISEEATGNEMGSDRRISITALDTLKFLQTLQGFGQVYLREDVPGNWREIEDADLFKAIYHTLRWNTNFFQRGGIRFDSPLVDYDITALDVPEENVYEQVKFLADQADFGFGTNYYGQAIIGPNNNIHATAAQNAAVSAYSPLMLSQRDTTEIITIYPGDVQSGSLERSVVAEAGWDWIEALLVSQINASEHVENLATAFAVAPGYAPAQGAGSKTKKMIASSQEQAAVRGGNTFASQDNMRKGHLRIVMARGGRVGVVPAEYEWMRLSGFDDELGIVSDVPIDGLYLCVSVEYTYDHEKGLQTLSYELEPYAEGDPAQLYVPNSDDGLGELPPVDDILPPLSITPEELPYLGRGRKTVGMVTRQGYILRTGPMWNSSGFDIPSGSGGPTWTSDNLFSYVSGGLLTNEVCHSLCVNPFSPGYTGEGTSIQFWLATNKRIIFVDDAFGSITATAVHTFSGGPVKVIIQTERSIRNYVICEYVSLESGSYYTRLCRSIDGANFTESIFGSAASPALNSLGMFMSPRGSSPTNCRLYLNGSDGGQSSRIFETFDGSAFSDPFSGIISSGQKGLGFIVVPYQDKTCTLIAYSDQAYPAITSTPGKYHQRPLKIYNGSVATVKAGLYTSFSNEHYYVCFDGADLMFPRLFSFADDDKNVGIFLGTDFFNSDHSTLGVEDSWVSKAFLITSASTVPVATEISSSQSSLYTGQFMGAYMTDKNTAYVFGMANKIAYYDRIAGTFDMRNGNLTVSALPNFTNMIIGLFGGLDG